MKKPKSTSTSSFGVSKRESHDSSKFYSRKLYNDYKKKISSTNEVEIPKGLINEIHLRDSRDLSILPENSVQLMVTSPPYNVGKEYDEDLDIKEYRGFLKSVFKEVHRVLVFGGRACINIANIGRRPYIPLHTYIIADMLDIGYLMRGEVIWNKGASAGTSTAWGSWMSATNPCLRDVHEYILVFTKGSMSRHGNGRVNSISRNEFLEYTKSIWTFPSESANRVGHPAPYPVELPYRLIQLYKFEEDVVLDPFCGSGTTCIAALRTRRHYIGFDSDKKYVYLARDRIRRFLNI